MYEISVIMLLAKKKLIAVDPWVKFLR